MFLREVKAAGGRHCYLRLVESFRQGGKVKQRVVAHLGRKDLLAPHLDSLVRLLQAEDPSPGWVRAEEISTPQAWTWGPLLAASHLFGELQLGAILDGPRRRLRHGQPLSERVFPLVANRLTRPGSEHALAQWLEDFYVCTGEGRRWVPQWKQWRRVKVSFEQLRLWYQTLDDLLAEKARIEKEIYLELRNLFSLQADLVFYDLTSTYFEGRGPGQLGQFGYSRDGKPRKRQILVGVVMVDGWPIAHQVFAGNRLDQTTVQEVLEDLGKRFALGRVIFVGDRGMVNVPNLERLRKDGWGYVVGLQRRRRQHLRLHPGGGAAGAVAGLPGRDHGWGKGHASEDAGAGSGREGARGTDLGGAQRGTGAVRAQHARTVDGASAKGTGGLTAAGGQGGTEGAGEDWSGGGALLAEASRTSLFRLGVAEGEILLFRASGVFGAREGV